MNNSTNSIANDQAVISRMSRQLAAKEATIKYLRAKLERVHQDRDEPLGQSYVQPQPTQQTPAQHHDASKGVTTKYLRGKLDRVEPLGQSYVRQKAQQSPAQRPDASTITLRDYLLKLPRSTRRKSTRNAAPTPAVSRPTTSTVADVDKQTYMALQQQLEHERHARRQADARRQRDVNEANARRILEVNKANNQRWRDLERSYRHSHDYVSDMRVFYQEGTARVAEMYHEWQRQDQAARASMVVQNQPTEVSGVEALVVEEDRALKEAIRELVCVRVVCRAVLPRGAELMPLISSFIISIETPIDIAVNCSSYHITEWLLANGSTPSLRTAHVAVLTRSLAMVQMIFHHLNLKYRGKERVPSLVFTDLPIASQPIADSTTEPVTTDTLVIAEWILREYPMQMAREAVRVAASHSEYVQTPLTWYAKRLKRHWQWEEHYAREIYRQKRARASNEVLNGSPALPD